MTWMWRWMAVTPVAAVPVAREAAAERRLRQRTRRRVACRAFGEAAIAQRERPVAIAAPDQRALGGCAGADRAIRPLAGLE